MPHEPTSETRELLIQLARLGDLVQSIPAIEALREAHPERTLDVLCAAPLAAMLAGSQTIHHAIAWDGTQWRIWAGHWAEDPVGMLRQAWEVYAPQMGAYVQRAVDPTEAPKYGVPGDE